MGKEGSAGISELDRARTETRDKERHAVFGGVRFHPDKVQLVTLNGSKQLDELPMGDFDPVSAIGTKLTENKVVAAGYAGANRQGEELQRKLWLDHDIVPHKIEADEDPLSIAERVAQEYSPDGIPKIKFDPHREVIPTQLVPIDAYKESDPQAFEQLEYFAKRFGDRKISFISSTPQGGGVALMRHRLTDLLHQLGVDAHWHVMEPDPDAFKVTKGKFHNILQNVAPEGDELTDDDIATYNRWTGRNAEILRPVFEKSDIIVIDDPQPSGLIKAIVSDTPTIYRSHIQIESQEAGTHGTPQHTTWEFLWNGGIKDADLFVSHPVEKFVPENIPSERVVFMGATTDRFDGLNKKLTSEQMNYYLDEVDELLEEQGQSSFDRDRPWIAQIARFDPSKNIDGVIEEYRLLRKKMEKDSSLTDIPQLVLAGHSAVDDPDGKPVYEHIMGLLQEDKYHHISSDVKVVRVPHKDQPLNALLQGASVVMQRSTEDGFEVKVTEALMKGKPVIVSNRGGIPLQVVDGEGGFIVDPKDHKKAAELLYALHTDSALYDNQSKYARENANPAHTTVQNAVNWMYLATMLAEGRKVKGDSAHVKDAAREEFEKAKNEHVIFEAPTESPQEQHLVRV